MACQFVQLQQKVDLLMVNSKLQYIALLLTTQALNDAKRELRYLLVYLHGDDHQDTDEFCRYSTLDLICLHQLSDNIEPCCFLVSRFYFDIQLFVFVHCSFLQLVMNTHKLKFSISLLLHEVCFYMHMKKRVLNILFYVTFLPFLSTTLCTEEVTAFLNTRMLFWACSTSKPEGYRGIQWIDI